MNIDDVKRTACAMPLTSPAFPPGPSGAPIQTDMTLGLGRVIHDDLA